MDSEELDTADRDSLLPGLGKQRRALSQVLNVAIGYRRRCLTTLQ
jgi:hypothetical protein